MVRKMRIGSNLAVVIFLVLVLQLLSAAGSPSKNSINAKITGYLTDPELNEVSGLAHSAVTPDLLWMINDSGGAPVLYAVNSAGTLQCRVRVEHARNRDWEDLAGFVWRGHSYLLIADCGDNRQHHASHTLYIVREPRLGGHDLSSERHASIAWQINFKYPDRGHDAEAVSVDGTAEKVYVLTKRERVPIVFELPLRPAQKGMVVASPIARIAHLPQPTADELKLPYGDKRSWPTAMDINPQGNRAVVLTYSHAYLFQRPSGTSWDQAFAGVPIRIILPAAELMPALSQREAICFAPDGKHLFVTSEGVGAALLKVKLSQDAASSARNAPVQNR